jgi:TolA-binding protein
MKMTIPYFLSISTILLLSGCNGTNESNGSETHSSSLSSTLSSSKDKKEVEAVKENTSYSSTAINISTSKENSIIKHTEKQRLKNKDSTENSNENDSSINNSSNDNKQDSANTQNSSQESTNNIATNITPSQDESVQEVKNTEQAQKGECRVYNPITGGCEAY